MKIKKQKKKAFTLAEVLITLSVIGVIAALTISVVAKNAQEAIWKSSAKVAYSKFSRVVSLIRQNEGSLAQYYTYTSTTFKPAMMRYMHVLKDCGQQGCVYGSIQSPLYKSLTGDAADTLHMGNDGQFVTADGMFFNIQQPSGPGTGASAILDDGTVDVFLDPLSVVIDTNGFNKKPNAYGKDTFAFQILKDVVVPMGAPNTACPAPRCCNRKEKHNRQGLGCMYYVMQGINY